MGIWPRRSGAESPPPAPLDGPIAETVATLCGALTREATAFEAIVALSALLTEVDGDDAASVGLRPRTVQAARVYSNTPSPMQSVGNQPHPQ